MDEDTRIVLGEAGLATFSDEEIEEYQRIMEARKEEIFELFGINA